MHLSRTRNRSMDSQFETATTVEIERTYRSSPVIETAKGAGMECDRRRPLRGGRRRWAPSAAAATPKGVVHRSFEIERGALRRCEMVAVGVARALGRRRRRRSDAEFLDCDPLAMATLTNVGETETSFVFRSFEIRGVHEYHMVVQIAHDRASETRRCRNYRLTHSHCEVGRCSCRRYQQCEQDDLSFCSSRNHHCCY